MDYDKPRHTISYVAHRTGLSTHVIRVWERRYGAVQPERTGTNRRLYSDADIDRLRLLAKISDAGHTISRIAEMDTAELEAIMRDLYRDSLPATDGAPSSNGSRLAGHLLSRCLAAVQSMDEDALEAALLEARIKLSQPALLHEVVGPLVQWIGTAWHEGRIRVSHEHFATAVIKSFLASQRRSHPVADNAPGIAIATPLHEQHEIGAQMVGVLAHGIGWRVHYFGPDIPADELANAATKVGARVVALSVAVPSERDVFLGEMRTLRNGLPERVPVLAGGSGVQPFREDLEAMGIRCPDTLLDLSGVLETYFEEASGANVV